MKQPEIGSTANRYEILAKLAEGGMAEIFLARGATAGGIERYVVLKRILRERANDTELVEMFLQEARLAAQLQHPNIAQVYDIGRLGESYFFTMEYVHGETVRAIVKRAHAEQRPVPIACVLAIAHGAAAGLQHAHDRKGPNGKPLGIVHRDVSPSNLICSYEGHVKLVDFGVAKAADRVTQTMKGTVKGKIAYLSPEQADNKRVDRRSDLFALGIVLWELMTGEYLYRRDSDFLTMTAIVEEPARPPSELREDVPPALDFVTLRLLAKDPAARFQTAGELVESIETIAARLGVPLTQTTLARFMRDRFGERPEPWVELEAGGSISHLMVDSDPIPDRLTAITSSVDDQLRKVPTLPPTEIDPEELKATIMFGATPKPTLRERPLAPTLRDRPAGRKPISPLQAAQAMPTERRLGVGKTTPPSGSAAMSAAESLMAAPERSPMRKVAALLALAAVIVAVVVIVFARQQVATERAAAGDAGTAKAIEAPADAPIATVPVNPASEAPVVHIDAATPAPAAAPKPRKHHGPARASDAGAAAGDDCDNDPMACQK